MEDDAWIEAWIRRKPKLMLHNQILIQISLAAAIASPIPLTGLAFWLAFDLYPSVFIPAIIVIWLVTLTAFSTIRLWNTAKKGKE
jgi:hypothetical protein